MNDENTNLLNVLQKCQEAFINRNDEEMLQAQSLCTEAIIKAKECVANDEKKIAQAILDAQKYHEESYYIPAEDGSGIGAYKLEFEECFQMACKNQNLSPNLWHLLVLANYWYNDTQLWAKDVLAGKNI